MTKDLLPKIIIQILTKVFSLRKKIYRERKRYSSYSYHRSIKRLNRSTGRPDAANLREEGHEATTCEPTSPFDRLLVRVFVRAERVCSTTRINRGKVEARGERKREKDGQKERAMGGKVGGSMGVGNQIADERKQAGEINLPISAACC